jgi:hypothetical protein
MTPANESREPRVESRESSAERLAPRDETPIGQFGDLAIGKNSKLLPVA